MLGGIARRCSHESRRPKLAGAYAVASTHMQAQAVFSCSELDSWQESRGNNIPNPAQPVERYSRLRSFIRLRKPIAELILQLIEDAVSPDEVRIAGVWHEN